MSHQLAMSCRLSNMHLLFIGFRYLWNVFSPLTQNSKNSLVNGVVNWKLKSPFIDWFIFIFSCWFHRRKFIIEMQFTWYHDIHSNLLDFSWMNVINVYFFVIASCAWTFSDAINNLLSKAICWRHCDVIRFINFLCSRWNAQSIIRYHSPFGLYANAV